MRVVIIGLVFVAIILAGGTAYLLRDYLSTQQAEIASQKPVAATVEVMVASSDMPVGTVINANNVDWIDWPEDNVPSGFLARIGDNDPLEPIAEEKHLARRGFIKGEPITMERLYKSDDPGFLRGSLAPGMRAVAIRTSAEVGASGFILPNDRVDVLLTHKMAQEAIKRQGGSSDVPALQHTSETIIEDIRVLAVDQKTNEFEGGAAVAKTILLEVSAKQAEIVNAAIAMGTVSLALRSAEKGIARKDPRFTTDVQVSSVLKVISGAFDDQPAPAPASSNAAAATPVYTPPARPKKKVITVYRGGQAGAAQ